MGNYLSAALHYLTSSSIATFRIFHKNSNMENINAIKHPRTSTTKTPPIFVKPSSSLSSSSYMDKHYFFKQSYNRFFNLRRSLQRLTSHLLSPWTFHHLSLSSRMNPDSCNLNTDSLIRVRYGES